MYVDSTRPLGRLLLRVLLMGQLYGTRCLGNMSELFHSDQKVIVSASPSPDTSAYFDKAPLASMLHIVELVA